VNIKINDFEYSAKYVLGLLSHLTIRYTP